MSSFKYFFLIFLCSCSTYPIKRMNIVHDYIFVNALKMCENNDGVHYLIKTSIITSKNPNNSFPCKEQVYVRCQNGSIHIFNDGGKFCFISESQINETQEQIQEIQ